MAAVLPMESNPETMNKYLEKLGVSNKWHMVDVVSLEKDALNWVPRPVLAVILLFPLSENYERYRTQQENELLSIGQQAPKNVFHLKQILSNICGTVALVHSVANNTHSIDLEDGPLKKYLKDAKDLDATAKGELLENSKAILDAYRDVSNANEDDDTDQTPNNHFVTFIHKDGILYELDGRKALPINHGSTTPETLLDNSVKVIKQFMDREPDNIGFNVVALVSSE